MPTAFTRLKPERTPGRFVLGPGCVCSLGAPRIGAPHILADQGRASATSHGDTCIAIPNRPVLLTLPGYLCLYMEKDELLGSTLILTWVPNSRIQRQDEEALRYITPESSPVRKAPRPRGRRAQSLGAPHQASPTEPRPALIPRDADTLGVAQSVPDAVRVSPSPPSEDGDKLARGLGMAPPPAHSDSGILSAVSSQDGTEEGREPRPEAGEEEGSLELSADGVSRDSSFDSDSDAFSSPFCLSPISAALGDSGSSVFLDSESG